MYHNSEAITRKDTLWTLPEESEVHNSDGVKTCEWMEMKISKVLRVSINSGKSWDFSKKGKFDFLVESYDHRKG